MERGQSLNSIEINRLPISGKVTTLSHGLASVIDQRVSLAELHSWGDEMDDVEQAERILRLHSSISAISRSEQPTVPYENFTGLIDAAVGVCLIIDQVAEEAHAFISNHLDQVDQVVSAHGGAGIDKVVNLLSIKNTPRTDAYLLKHFAEAVVSTDERGEFDWIFEDFTNSKTNTFIPTIVRGFATVLQEGSGKNPEVKEKVREWAAIPCPQSYDFFSWSREHLKSAKSYVERMVELEEEEPGSTAYLMDEYGIHCFSRYPKELLLDQYRNRSINTGRPHGILLSSLHDWNESSVRGGKAGVYNRFYTQVKEAGYEMRVAEVATKGDLLYMTHKLSAQFGKMNFAIVEGHANAWHIVLGEEQGNYVTYRDLKSKESQVIMDTLEDGATIVLAGCKLGQIGGFAQKLSERGYTVIASNENSSIRGLTFFPEEYPPIDLTFKESEYTNIYRNGVIISNRGEKVI